MLYKSAKNLTLALGHVDGKFLRDQLFVSIDKRVSFTMSLIFVHEIIWKRPIGGGPPMSCNRA